uniref:Gamma-tubulin complex component n=1 Tax=Rhizophora mucronata TaxID=61149 RepID=A0A2P2LDQ5_RHIMU
MEVDKSLGYLLENLKVLEDPWLPPKSWESIPSENAHHHRHRRRQSLALSHAPGYSPPTQQQPLYPTSSVSEESLVRLALNSLQGVQSAFLSIEKLSAAFCSDPADCSYLQNSSLWNRSSSTHAIGKILKSIGCLGSLVFLLRKFVDNFVFMDYETYSAEKRRDSSESAPNQSRCDSDVQNEQNPPYSLVNQAFAVTVKKVLDGYICALDTLSASVCLRRLSKSVDVSLHTSYGVDCLTSVVHPEVTLLEVYLHTSDLRTQIEALGNICNLNEIALCFSVSSFEELIAKATGEFSKFPRGGDLLSYLYKQLQVADPAHCALLKFLFLRTCEPYCGFIRSWIFKAEISDPYKEFVVEYVDNMPSNLDRKAGFLGDVPLAIIRDGVAVPCFLKDLLIPLVRAGQQLQVLKKLLELCDWAGPDDCTYEDFLPYWSDHLSNQLFCASPLAFSKRCLHAMVVTRSSYYSSMLENLENLLTKLEVRHQRVMTMFCLGPLYISLLAVMDSEYCMTID